MNSHTATATLPEYMKHQLVLEELDKDPGRRQGPSLIKESIRMRTGIDLTRDFVEEEMRLQDPEGFALCDPTSKRIKRRPLVNIGIHEEWSGDGHDKLKRIGLAIYGIRDVWSGKWLGLWVIPDNRLKDVIAYLWLCLVEEYGGMSMPYELPTTTDCGSETTMVYGLGTALRSLARWLWSVLVQQEINVWKERFNAHKPRRDPQKVNPSGVSPNVAFALPAKYNGLNCLRKFTDNSLELVRQLNSSFTLKSSCNLFPRILPPDARRR
ncbi:hypothetical protein M422DRAFT_256186 [Sphaerobolus stellatus SS14]|uniref:Unplaced genomic scaffold SPHSTscaffold_66, whole genome shotgun sequence n=1 Tax=Sphaerobolus stellatus (strain SS14) TaxID=990650 RepID=A0A0C9VR25_SPHS4|nr:hypothetical protein M422DRAFT_256186 [Sphaerobolus stellatus SS14]